MSLIDVFKVRQAVPVRPTVPFMVRRTPGRTPFSVWLRTTPINKHARLEAQAMRHTKQRMGQ